jgi:hypothetical protein
MSSVRNVFGSPSNSLYQTEVIIVSAEPFYQLRSSDSDDSYKSYLAGFDGSNAKLGQVKFTSDLETGGAGNTIISYYSSSGNTAHDMIGVSTNSFIGSATDRFGSIFGVSSNINTMTAINITTTNVIANLVNANSGTITEFSATNIGGVDITTTNINGTTGTITTISGVDIRSTNVNGVSGIYTTLTTTEFDTTNLNATTIDTTTVDTSTITASGLVLGENITANVNISAVNAIISANLFASNAIISTSLLTASISANANITTTSTTITENLTVNAHVGTTSLTASGLILGENITANDTISTVSFTGETVNISTLLTLGSISNVEVVILDQSYNGFVSLDGGNPTFVDGTRTLTIPANFTYYSNGLRYTSSSLKSKQISTDLGLHYLYINGETLTETTTWSDNLITDYCIVAIIYWDGTKQIYYGAEYDHGYLMDSETHLYTHDTLGFALKSGGDLGDILVDENGTSNTHCEFSVSATTAYDEDAKFEFTAKSSTTNIGVYYLLGSSAIWHIDESRSFPVINATTGDLRAVYNQNDGGTWKLTEVSNNDFLLAHIFTYNDITRKFGAIMGQNIYLNRTAARAGALTEINTLLTVGAPTTEFKFLGTLIIKTSNGYSNPPKSILKSTDTGDDYIDLRGALITRAGVSTSVTDHQSLSGLYETNSTTLYGHITNTSQTIYGEKTFDGITTFSTNVGAGNIIVSSLISGGSANISGNINTGNVNTTSLVLAGSISGATNVSTLDFIKISKDTTQTETNIENIPRLILYQTVGSGAGNQGYIGGVLFGGDDEQSGALTEHGAGIFGWALDYENNDHPTSLEFHTTPSGSSSLTKRMVISHDGNVRYHYSESVNVNTYVSSDGVFVIDSDVQITGNITYANSTSTIFGTLTIDGTTSNIIDYIYSNVDYLTMFVDNGVSMQMGTDGQFIVDATTFYFREMDSDPTYLKINASVATFDVNVNINGNTNISTLTTNLITSSTDLELSANSNVQIYGDLWIKKPVIQPNVSIDLAPTLFIFSENDSGAGNQGNIAKISFGGSDDSTEATQTTYKGAMIVAEAPYDYTTSETPTNLQFWTTPTGSYDSPKKRLTIGEEGEIIIYGTTNGSSTFKISVDDVNEKTTFELNDLEVMRFDEGEIQIYGGGEDSILHLKSEGMAQIIMEADTLNINEAYQPQIIMKQDGEIVLANLGFFESQNRLRIENAYDTETNGVDIIGNSVALKGINTSTTYLTANSNVSTFSTSLHVIGGIIVGNMFCSTTICSPKSAIQIYTDTSITAGGYDEHTGAMIYTHMTGGWGTADLRIKTSNDWGEYETDDAIIISHDLTTVRNNLVVGGSVYSEGILLSSDQRLKSSIITIENALTQIETLQPRQYYKREDLQHHHYGFITQEIEEQYSMDEYIFVSFRNDGYQALDYTSFIPLNTKGIQELKVLHDNLRSDFDYYVSSHTTLSTSNTFCTSENIGRIVSYVDEANLERSNTYEDNMIMGVLTNSQPSYATIEFGDNEGYYIAISPTIVDLKVISPYPTISTINKGDLICSSGLWGYGSKQQGDMIHSYTIAKALTQADFVNGYQVVHKSQIYTITTIKARLIQ